MRIRGISDLRSLVHPANFRKNQLQPQINIFLGTTTLFYPACCCACKNSGKKIIFCRFKPHHHMLANRNKPILTQGKYIKTLIEMVIRTVST